MRDWEAHWHEGDTPWDKGEAAPPLFEYLEEWNDACLAEARVLVPGCGSGHDVRALAASGARVTGLDLSPTAIKVARSHTPVSDEEYVEGNLFQFSPGEPFDAVWEHTCYCAIEPGDRPRYAESMARLVRPGGALVGAFYLTPENGDGGPPFGTTEKEVLEHLAPFFALVAGQPPRRAFPSRVGKEWLARFKRLA